MTPQIVRQPDAESLASVVANRLLASLAAAQEARGTASVVLTGGGIGTATLRAVAADPARDSVDWSRVEIWWGDERYLPAGDPERNETGARAALLDALPVHPDRVHSVAGPDRSPDVEASAASLEAELTSAAVLAGTATPQFDVLLLGVGPDAHVASLFPEHPALSDDRLAVPVHGSPKPPLVRVSLSFRAIRGAREVWLLAAGAEKADAVGLALSPGAGERQAPAAGATGTEATVWFLDDASAQGLSGS